MRLVYLAREFYAVVSPRADAGIFVTKLAAAPAEDVGTIAIPTDAERVIRILAPLEIISGATVLRIIDEISDTIHRFEVIVGPPKRLTLELHEFLEQIAELFFATEVQGLDPGIIFGLLEGFVEEVIFLMP